VRLIKKILLSFTIILFLSCNSTSNKDSCGSAWIGGEIVNPKNNFVTISHNRNIIDTVSLDDKNFFRYKIEQVDPGIYFFQHFEYQALYIEPGDSIMLRVNTIEFDESLSYSGKGSEKNNFLMELFLLNEEVDQNMPAYYSLSPSGFEAKMDSIRGSRWDLFQMFKEENTISNGFEATVIAAIDYSIYSKKELYISANAKKQLYDESIQIPESFFAFRKNIDLGNESLRNYYPYFRFLGYYLDNLAFEKYKGEAPFNRESYTHNLHKVYLIDSLITNDSLKNSLLRNAVGRYFLNGDNAMEEAKMLEVFKKLNTSPSDHRELIALGEATMKLVPGNAIPNVMLLTTGNTVKDLREVIKNPTVIYFWSSQSANHYRKIHTRANELRSKYPDFHFIGINVDNHFKKWMRIVDNSGYSPQFEFQFENFDDAEMKLLVNSVNKSIVVNPNGIILDGNTNIFGLEIEQQLLGFLNQ
jgi:Thioredoxin-like